MNETKIREWSEKNMVAERLRLENAGKTTIKIGFEIEMKRGNVQRSPLIM
jgi:hypothetical protein